VNKGLFSSYKTDWKTPKGLYNELNKEFNFDFDPCPLKRGDFDGLKIAWGKRNFVNPPYGNAIKHWIKKAFNESQKGKLVVLLIPSRTDTHWWHDFIMKANEIRFIKGRLKFGDAKNSAPFPSAIIIFRGRNEKNKEEMSEYEEDN